MNWSIWLLRCYGPDRKMKCNTFVGQTAISYSRYISLMVTLIGWQCLILFIYVWLAVYWLLPRGFEISSPLSLLISAGCEPRGFGNRHKGTIHITLSVPGLGLYLTLLSAKKLTYCVNGVASTPQNVVDQYHFSYSDCTFVSACKQKGKLIFTAGKTITNINRG